MSTRRRSDDRGSTLILVLVMIVIGSMIVIPLMQYTVTVLRANTVLSEKSKRIEGIKSGLRIALADPARLYEACGAGGPTVPVQLAPATINGLDIETECYLIDHASAQAVDQMRIGLTATRAAAPIPTELSGTRFTTVAPSATAAWWASTTVTSQTNRIWLPNLPTHGLNRRSPAGYAMPAGFPACTVYFPGTYPDPLVLTGPTYFASGIYYFENEVRLQGGASVVVGLGATEGCSADQEAIFNAVNPPSSHNMNGLGATWVLGARARVIVDNSNGSSVSLKFNARYVTPGDEGTQSSQEVSIMSVNGALNGTMATDLHVDNVIDVPLSLVALVGPVGSTDQDYLPSVLTPKPTPPTAPTAPTATRFSTAVHVAWTAPAANGSPITAYVVTASTGPTCTTSGATTCVVTGLTNGSPVTFKVVARNAAGDSAASTASASVTPGGTITLTAPAQPASPTAVPYANSARVSWSAPTDGGAPITSYTVTASPGGQTCTVDASTAIAPTLRCDIVGLDALVLPGHTFSVTARNAVGVSPSSAASLVPIVPAPVLGPPPAAPAPPAPAAYVPTAIVEIDLPSPAAAEVVIPGYISIPQGRMRVNNPHGLNVSASGGILAAQYDISDSRSAGPTSLPIGFLETVVQRVLRLVSTTSTGYERSTAIVQVNQNGAYAINSWEVQ